MKNSAELGKTIRELRGNMSLRDFAAKCDTTHTTIDNLEKGFDFRTGKPTQVKMATLQKIAEACGVSLSYLTGESPISHEQELKVALFGGDTEVTDEMWNEVMNYAEFLKQKYKKT